MDIKWTSRIAAWWGEPRTKRHTILPTFRTQLWKAAELWQYSNVFVQRQYWGMLCCQPPTPSVHWSSSDEVKPVFSVLAQNRSYSLAKFFKSGGTKNTVPKPHNQTFTVWFHRIYSDSLTPSNKLVSVFMLCLGMLSCGCSFWPASAIVKVASSIPLIYFAVATGYTQKPIS